MKMPKELKQKWLEALRSGEYKQAVGGLKSDNGHCCLGVLCEVGEQGFVPVSDSYEGDYRLVVNGLIGSPGREAYENMGVLVQMVAPASGAVFDSDQATLIELNDEKKASFSEIADWIKNNIEVLP